MSTAYFHPHQNSQHPDCAYDFAAPARGRVSNAYAEPVAQARERTFGWAMVYLSGMVAITWMSIMFVMATPDVRATLLSSQDTATGVIAVAGLCSMGILWLLEHRLSNLSIIEQGEATTQGQDKSEAEVECKGLLFLFTLGQAVIVSVPCALLAEIGLAPLVFYAFGMTFFLFLGLTVFAMQTKYDFTPHKGIVLMALQGFLFWSLFGFDVTAGVIVGCLILFMVYVIISVQQVLHQSRPGTATSMLAAVKLYSGFVNIFIRILHLMLLSKVNEGERRRNGRRT